MEVGGCESFVRIGDFCGNFTVFVENSRFFVGKSRFFVENHFLVEKHDIPWKIRFFVGKSGLSVENLVFIANSQLLSGYQSTSERPFIHFIALEGLLSCDSHSKFIWKVQNVAKTASSFHSIYTIFLKEKSI